MVQFKEHVPSKSVASMVSSIAAYGLVNPTSNDRSFEIVVFRPSKLPKLQQQLTKWDEHGFLEWSQEA
jgi:hypothetical protein